MLAWTKVVLNCHFAHSAKVTRQKGVLVERHPHFLTWTPLLLIHGHPPHASLIGQYFQESMFLCFRSQGVLSSAFERVFMTYGDLANVCTETTAYPLPHCRRRRRRRCCRCRCHRCPPHQQQLAHRCRCHHCQCPPPFNQNLGGLRQRSAAKIPSASRLAS